MGRAAEVFANNAWHPPRRTTLRARDSISREVCLRAFAACLSLAAALAAALVRFPRLDLVVSNLFVVEGTPFPAAGTVFWDAIRSLMIMLTDGVMLVVVSMLAVGVLAPRLRVIRPRILAIAAGVYIIVPGLIVNAVLKGHWGRTRPRLCWIVRRVATSILFLAPETA